MFGGLFANYTDSGTEEKLENLDTESLGLAGPLCGTLTARLPPPPTTTTTTPVKTAVSALC
jgi:hypothetical protein